MYEYKIKILRVIDGDTVDVLVDIGFSVHKKIRIRMMGIDTPESRTRDLEEKKRGLASKTRFKEMLKNSKGNIRLISHGVGKFGRCLGELFSPEFECSLNQQMINEGFAYEYFGGNKELAKERANRKKIKKKNIKILVNNEK